MKVDEVQLPGGKRMPLYYLGTHPPEGFDPPSLLSVLQYRKDGKSKPEIEAGYAKEEPKIAAVFADRLFKAEPNIALILTPPSASKQFMPYVGAFEKLAKPIAVLHDLVTKPDGFKSGDPDRTLDELRAAFAINPIAVLPAIKATDTVGIVDDIYGDGKTITAMLELVVDLFPQGVRIVAACPLRIVRQAT